MLDSLHYNQNTSAKKTITQTKISRIHQIKLRSESDLTQIHSNEAKQAKTIIPTWQKTINFKTLTFKNKKKKKNIKYEPCYQTWL